MKDNMKKLRRATSQGIWASKSGFAKAAPAETCQDSLQALEFRVLV